VELADDCRPPLQLEQEKQQPAAAAAEAEAETEEVSPPAEIQAEVQVVLTSEEEPQAAPVERYSNLFPIMRTDFGK
jgi:hypothetical protein